MTQPSAMAYAPGSLVKTKSDIYRLNSADLRHELEGRDIPFPPDASVGVLRSLLSDNFCGLLVTLDSGKKTKTYTSVRDLESDFAAGDVHPGELKDMVEHYLNILLVPIRAAFTSADKRDLVNRAYPKTYKGGVDELKPWRLDLCVGTIIKAENHPDSSGYLILHLNDGSLERRVGVVPQDSFTELIDLLGRPVILLRNIAPTKTLGIQVTALILYAQNPIGDKVELVLPRDEPTIASGTKVHIQGCESGSPDRQLKTGEGVWDRVKVDLEVNSVGDVEWRGKAMLTAQHRPICAHFLKEVPLNPLK